MKCQILFSGKNKKNIINLSSAENAQRVVKVNSDSVQISVSLCWSEESSSISGVLLHVRQVCANADPCGKT